MGRGPTKAQGNRWCTARLKWKEVDERFASRSGAAEVMGLTEEIIKSVELGLYKNMPVQTAVIMADAYHDPSLLNPKRYSLPYDDGKRFPDPLRKP